MGLVVRPPSAWRILLLTSFVLIVAFLAMVFYPRGLGTEFYQRFAVGQSIRYQYEVNGLWPPSTEEFFSSIVGDAAGRLRSKSPSPGPYHSLRLQTTQRGNRIVVSIDLACSSGGSTSQVQLVESLPHSAKRQTLRLLRAASSGTAWWRKTVARWFWRFDRAFPGSVSVSPPDTGFDIPRTRGQLVRYRAWLGQIAGSANRLRDGWGKRIRLSLDEKFDPPRLVAASAGPDGKWDTEDDMILKRDTKTGKIVEKLGFDQESEAKPKPE